MRALDSIPWYMVVLLCATVGLAPFTPEPHLWQKLRLIAEGQSLRGIDWFDLVFHALPWLLLVAKMARQVARR